MLSVERAVQRRAAGVLVASLLLAGLGTAIALWVQSRRGLDTALLAAAHETAHPEAGPGWEVESGRSPVETWIVKRDDARVPIAAVDAAIASERATFVDVGSHRLVLLPAEARVDGRERHVIVAARSRAPSFFEVLGGFGLAYGLLAPVVATVGVWATGRAVRGAFTPVDRARAEIEAAASTGRPAKPHADLPVEVQGLVGAFNRLVDRLDTAYAAQRRFSAEAAHELRTPVTALLGEIDVALRRPRGAAEYEATLQSARDSADRLRRVVEALRAMSRLDTGEVELTRVATDTETLTVHALALERTAIEAGGGTVLAVGVEPRPVPVNAELVELALANLLRNAGRHARGSAVELRGAARGEDYVFTVDDAGPGIAPAERAAALDRFSRGARARVDDPEGLGLGLAFAREVALRHGGELRLDRSPLGGLRAELSVRS